MIVMAADLLRCLIRRNQANKQSNSPGQVRWPLSTVVGSGDDT
jgi:hypothetical protein